MSLTTSLPKSSASPLPNAIKSVGFDIHYRTEEKDIEEESYVAPIVENKEPAYYDQAQCVEKSGDIDTENRSEEEVVNSVEFEKEWSAALDNVLKIAQIDRKVILENARKEYKRETGEEATDEMIADAIKTFCIQDIDDDAETKAEQDITDVDPQVFRKEFEEALQVVRKVAKVHQEQLVNTICDISNELCGKEPEPQQMSEIFGRIKVALAEEAREEFLDLYEDNDKDHSDDDYSPETDACDYSQDIKDDKFESDAAEDDNDEAQ